MSNLNNLWSFIEIYAVFVLNLCGEKTVWKKDDEYEVCLTGVTLVTIEGVSIL